MHILAIIIIFIAWSSAITSLFFPSIYLTTPTPPLPPVPLRRALALSHLQVLIKPLHGLDESILLGE